MKSSLIAFAVLVMICFCNPAQAVQQRPEKKDKHDGQTVSEMIKQVEVQNSTHDLRKSMIELPLEKAIGNIDPIKMGPEQPAAMLDDSKRRIEQPLERLVDFPQLDSGNHNANTKGATANSATRESINATTRRLLNDKRVVGKETSGPSDDNPPVKPGIVNWHKNFGSAIDASKKSGKPVLLFHLLGQLDQKFT